MRTHSKLAIVGVLIVTMIGGVYSLSLFFPSLVPWKTSSSPSNVIVNCSNMNLSQTTFYPGSAGFFAMTCNGGSALNVTRSEILVPTFANPASIGTSCCIMDFLWVGVQNFTSWNHSSTCYPKTYLNSGKSVALGQDSYVYCVRWITECCQPPIQLSTLKISVQWSSQ